MIAAFDALGLESMKVSEGRYATACCMTCSAACSTADMREATVAQFMRRYHVDAAQADRVKALSLKIYDALSPGAEREDDADRLMPGMGGAPRGDRAFRSRTLRITSTPPTCCPTPTCPASRAWSRRASPAS
jgi:hypothetical protein